MLNKKNNLRSEVAGVGIDLNNSSIKECKSVEYLKKLEIFNHLPEKQQESSYEELWNDINSKEEKSEEAEKVEE